MTARPLSICALFVCAAPALARQTSVTLLEDVDPFAFGYSGQHFNGGPIVPLANGFLFAARTEVDGQEPWISDGTPSGTRPLADLDIGGGWANPYDSLVLPGGDVLIAAGSTLWGSELFRFDPATETLELVADIRPGTEGSGASGLVLWNGEAYFYANDGVSGKVVWRTDGTPAGTELAYDFSDLGGSSNGTTRLVPTTGALFIEVSSPTGRLLAVPSPGSPPELLLSGVSASSVSDNFRMQAPLGNQLLFNFKDSVVGEELWISDGTAAGTRLLVDVWPGTGDSDPRLVAQDANIVWFSATTQAFGRELYSTDGTLAGSQFLGDVNPGTVGLVPTYATGTVVSGGLYFSGSNSPATSFQQKPFFTDGTIAGTNFLGEITGAVRFFEAGGTVYFSGNGPLGNELYRTDGTALGTQIAVDVVPGSNVQQLYLQAETPAGLLLSVDLNGNDATPYLVDPVTLAVTNLGNKNSGVEARGSQPQRGVDFQGLSVFRAIESFQPTQGPVWFSDGTPQGTQSSFLDVLEFEPLGTAGERLVYSRRTSFLQGSEGQVWSSTSTPGELLQLIPQGAGGPGVDVRETLVHDGELYLTIERNESDDLALYATDGTPAGTRLLTEAFPARSDGPLAEPTSFAGQVWFVKQDAIAGAELWRTDGTTTGTVRISDLAPGLADSFPNELTVAGDHLYFGASTAAAGEELYRVDASGAIDAVGQLAPGPLGSNPNGLEPLGERLFFAADNGVLGEEPYVTDGTPAGTLLLGDLTPGAGRVVFPIAAGEQVLFFTRDEFDQARLWATAGSPATTRALADTNGTGGTLVPFAMQPLGSGPQVVLPAWRSDLGLEPWIADAAADTFQLLQDVNPGPRSSSPRFWSRAGGRLVFAATDTAVGEEPRSISITGLGGYVAEPFGNACGASQIDSAGQARIGAAFDVALQGAPLAPAGLYYSRTRGFAPLFPGCPLLLGGVLVPLGVTTTDAAGTTALTLQIPGTPALVGEPVYLQWWSGEPSGPFGGAVGLSDGLEVWIGG